MIRAFLHVFKYFTEVDLRDKRDWFDEKVNGDILTK